MEVLKRRSPQGSGSRRCSPRGVLEGAGDKNDPDVSKRWEESAEGQGQPANFRNVFKEI